MTERRKQKLRCALALFLCITALVLSQARERRRLMTCKNVEIIFKDTLNFVSEDDVRGYLKRDCPVFIGQRVDSIRLYEIEGETEQRVHIRFAEPGSWRAAEAASLAGFLLLALALRRTRRRGA